LKKASEKQTRPRQITITRGGEALASDVIDFEGLTKGVLARASDRRFDVSSYRRGRHCRRDRPPNGARQDHAVPADHKQETPDKGAITVGDSVHLGYVDQSRD